MAGGDGADVEFFEPFHDGIHLGGHRCHEGVVEVAALLFGGVAVGFCPVGRAEVS